MSFTDLLVNQQPDEPAKVYISGAIPGSRDLGHKVLYQHAAHVFHDAGISVYIPHLHPAPTAGQARAMTPEEVFDRDAHHLLGARLIVAFIHEHSTGVDSELAIAVVEEVPAVARCHAGLTPSRFTEGLLHRAGIPVHADRNAWRDIPVLLTGYANAFANTGAVSA